MAWSSTSASGTSSSSSCLREVQRDLPCDMIQELLKSESGGRGPVEGGRSTGGGSGGGDVCRGIFGLVEQQLREDLRLLTALAHVPHLQFIIMSARVDM